MKNETDTKKQQVVSRLIGYLQGNNERIAWRRSCWRDGRDYNHDRLNGMPDLDFSSTTYRASLFGCEVDLEHHINWEDCWSSFGLNFSRHSMINLKPKPQSIDIISRNGNEALVFQARYSGWCTEYEEGKVAMLDFVENGKRLVPFFDGMSEEAIQKYKELLDSLRQHKDENIIVIG